MMPDIREAGEDALKLGLEVVDDAAVTFREGPWPERFSKVGSHIRRAGELAHRAATELPNTVRYRIGGAVIESIKDRFTYGTDLEHLNELDKPAFNVGSLEEEIGQGSE